MQIKSQRSPIREDVNIEKIQQEFGYNLEGVDKDEILVFSNNKCSDTDTEDVDKGEDSILSFLIKFKVSHRNPPLSAGLGSIKLPTHIGENKEELNYQNDDTTKKAKKDGVYFFASIHENHYNLHLKHTDQKTLVINDISQNSKVALRYYSQEKINDYLLESYERDDWKNLLSQKKDWKKHIRKALRRYFEVFKLENLKDESLYKEFAITYPDEKEKMYKRLCIYEDLGGKVDSKSKVLIEKYIKPTN